MAQGSLSRRSFLKLSAGALAGMALWRFDHPVHASAAEVSQVSLADLPQKAEEAAQKSALVAENWQRLEDDVASLHDGALQRKVQGVLDNPAPTFLKQYGAGDAARVYDELQSKGLIDPAKTDEAHLLPPIEDAGKTPQPFRTAPGSGYGSHHPYPGGLVTHTAANVEILKGIYQAYQTVFGYDCNYDVAVAAELLHDLAKPYVFQWQADGSSLKEYTIAGTGAHHIFSIAESIQRGLPKEVVVAQACAHNHPGSDSDAKQVEDWLAAASILAGKDPVALGLLTRDGKLTEPIGEEGFLVHLGDHDWGLSGFAAKKCVDYLKDYATQKLGVAASDTKRINAVRNYAGSQFSYMRLYQALTQGTRQADALMVTVFSNPA